jgi:hypothetical protein
MGLFSRFERHPWPPYLSPCGGSDFRRHCRSIPAALALPCRPSSVECVYRTQGRSDAGRSHSCKRTSLAAPLCGSSHCDKRSDALAVAGRAIVSAHAVAARGPGWPKLSVVWDFRRSGDTAHLCNHLPVLFEKPTRRSEFSITGSPSRTRPHLARPSFNTLPSQKTSSRSRCQSA